MSCTKKKSIGENIRSLRKSEKITQSQLAKQCGVSQSTITKCETGETSIGFELAIRIAAALNISMYDLVGAAEDPEQRAKYNAAHPIGSALDTILDSYGYSIIYESETPYLVGKGERLRLSDQLVNEFLENARTGFLVQIEILKEKARKAAADGE